jgi:hypothetical protein
MSVHKSYFSKNDTLIFNSYTNTGRNPVVELFFGRVDNVISPMGYSRFIFDLDLSQLNAKIADGTISTGCTFDMTHTLKMTNTSSFDEELLNTTWSNGRRRATSFDLVLFRIPKVSGSTGDPQLWDEGVGYDYYNSSTALNSSNAMSVSQELATDKSFSDRPVNWYQRTTVKNWSLPGIYDNTNSNQISGLNYSGLTIVDTQHFEFGNENIEFDMTDEINSLITGGTANHSGWGIAFVPDVENITGMTENYSVGFFSRHTQTFYEPYLETNYNDLVEDDRYTFYENKTNKLFLYTYVAGNPISLDEDPTVKIYDADDVLIGEYTACSRTLGMYEISVPSITSDTVPCMYYDRWDNLKYNGEDLPVVENEFVLQKGENYFTIGTETQEPKMYGFDFNGIKQGEKILSTDIRKVNVTIKKAYTAKEMITNVDAYYRVYVKEGSTEVQVQDWTKINRASDGYFFMFDMRDKIPNEYYIDMKVVSDREVNTYKRQVQFQIVNRK